MKTQSLIASLNYVIVMEYGCNYIKSVSCNQEKNGINIIILISYIFCINKYNNDHTLNV